MPDIQKDNTAVKQPLHPEDYPDLIGPPKPRQTDTGFITTDYSNPIQRAAQKYSAAYLNSNFANSAFMDVMRWFPGLHTFEKILTAQPVSEEEQMSFMMPMRMKSPAKKVNLDNYIDELEDAGIYFKQNKPKVKTYTSPVVDTYEAGIPILNEKSKNMSKDQIWTDKKAFDMFINDKSEIYPNYYVNPVTRRKIWNNYVSSMDRRRHNYFYEGMETGSYPDYVYIDKQASAPSAIFGFTNEGIFTPSHFAPSDLKSGYRMIKNLANEPGPVLFAVPDDLSSQLSKVGYVKVGEGMQPFNGELVKKNYMVNRGFAFEDIPEYMRRQINPIEFKEIKLTPMNGKHYFSENPSIFKDGSEKIKYILQ